jgi:hypothetical protein
MTIITEEQFKANPNMYLSWAAQGVNIYIEMDNGKRVRMTLFQ